MLWINVCLYVSPVYSKTISKDMLKRGQWGGWQQKNRQRQRRDEKETKIRGGSGPPKCLLRGVVCCCFAVWLLDESRTELSVCLALDGGYILSWQPQSHPSHVAELQLPHTLSWAATSSHQCKQTIPVRFCFLFPYRNPLLPDCSNNN